MLARAGNIAVTQSDGRAFPGIHVQGDTVATFLRELVDATGRLRHTTDDGEALEDLQYTVDEMGQILRFYESVLAAQGIRLPYAPLQSGQAHSGALSCVTAEAPGRRHSVARRSCAVAGVAACLADDDAEVYNISDGAVADDALAAALRLTALAAEAVQALAAATGCKPKDALRAIEHRQLPRGTAGGTVADHATQPDQPHAR